MPRANRLLVLSSLGLLAAGCAARAPSEAGGQPGIPQAVEQELRALEQAQAERLAILDQGLRAEAEPDCGRARELAGQICELGERICRIAERHPDSPALGDRCRDAKSRCEQARVKVAVRCPPES